MEKIIVALLLAACFALPAVAQSNESSKTTPVWDHGDNVSDLTYETVPIYRVLNHKDAYVVIYLKQNLKVANVVIPKKWAYGTVGRKLFFRTKPASLDSSMTVFYKGGEFFKVCLTVNPSQHDSIWGMVPNGTKLEGTDAETLELEF